VIDLYSKVDGDFPNHHPDPSKPENLADLIKVVQATDAELGLAFDGDGDRLGVVTRRGNIIYPDRQMMLFARDVLSAQPGGTIIFDVKCSSACRWPSAKAGGVPLMWKTGHSLIKAKLKETGAPIAGEMSGHIFFGERWYGFDDAMYTAAGCWRSCPQKRPQRLLDACPPASARPS
jgi:phosphomannomutase